MCSMICHFLWAPRTIAVSSKSHGVQVHWLQYAVYVYGNGQTWHGLRSEGGEFFVVK